MQLRKAIFAPLGTGKTWGDFGLLILRMSAGLMLALAHGSGKLPPSDKFIEGTGDLGFPVPVFFAWAASLSEFFGALLVAIGLATRPAAAFAGIVMATAVFLKHSEDPFAKKELPLLFLAVMVTLIFTGPGRYSLDGLISGKKR